MDSDSALSQAMDWNRELFRQIPESPGRASHNMSHNWYELILVRLEEFINLQ